MPLSALEYLQLEKMISGEREAFGVLRLGVAFYRANTKATTSRSTPNASPHAVPPFSSTSQDSKFICAHARAKLALLARPNASPLQSRPAH